MRTIQRYARLGRSAEYLRPDPKRWQNMAAKWGRDKLAILAPVTSGVDPVAPVAKPQHSAPAVLDLQRTVATWEAPADYATMVHPTKGPRAALAGMKRELVAANKGQYPVDLGYSPAAHPMAYLLSLGWGKQGKEGGNQFNRNELSALLYEFAPAIYGAANRVAFKYKLPEAKTKELRAGMEDWLFTLATKWRPESRGDATESNNFARYLWGNAALHAKEAVRTEGGKDAPDDEYTTPMPGAAYSGEEIARRTQSLRQVREALGRVLSPAEQAVLLSRLNATAPIAAEGETEAVKTWKEVRADLPGQLSDLSDQQLRGIFVQAMEKLKALPAHGYSHSQLAGLKDLAVAQREAMEGQRAEWPSDAEVRKLIVRPATLTRDEIQHQMAALDKHRETLKRQLTGAVTEADKNRLITERRVLAHAYLDLTTKLRGGSVAKSLVVQDIYGAIDALAAEFTLWGLSGR